MVSWPFKAINRRLYAKQMRLAEEARIEAKQASRERIDKLVREHRRSQGLPEDGPW